MVANPTKAQERALTPKQARFAKEYARLGNGTAAAKAAGYRGNDVTLAAIAYENLRKPQITSEVNRESDRLAHEEDYSALRVRRRLDRLSYGAEEAGQFGTAVRAEELIGKAGGMFVDQSLVLRGDLSADHLSALVEIARKRQEQPLDLGKPQGKARLLNE
jgi:hypothetical protein